MVNEIRHAIRALRRHPAFTAVAIVTLALDIGANTALFGIADLRRGNVGAGAAATTIDPVLALRTEE